MQFSTVRSLRPGPRHYLLAAFASLCLLLIFLYLNADLPGHIRSKGELGKPQDVKPIRYKPEPEEIPPIKDNFPLAISAKSPSDLPPVPSFNEPPAKHVPEATPLYIGFTRNWPLLQQTVVSYITAGWPASDIYVVDNGGTMNSNELGKLTLQNPFYLDYYRLTKVFGVNVVTTPTLLNFAQLQNFFMSHSLQNKWEYYFWGHMDVSIMSDEEWKGEDGSYKSIYMRAVDIYRESTAASFGKWGLRFFAYDRLVLVNLKAFMAVGGWDARIAYYMTDCDMHERLRMGDWKTLIADAGNVFDVNESIEDLLVYYRRKPATPGSGKCWGEEEERASEGYKTLKAQLEAIDLEKNTGVAGRLGWHTKQTGGLGEPFYIHPHAFQEMFHKMVDDGKDFYYEKWGHKDCSLRERGLKLQDAYRVLHDWE